MKIGITGSDGFLGFHVRAFFHALKIEEIRLANRETFNSTDDLSQFVRGLDVVIHLAGVNRGDAGEVLQGNIQIANQLVLALNRAESSPVLLYANSVHADKETAYGRGKAGAAEVFAAWANSCGARFINLILPHVFGEFGKPFYNSVVSTFCYQIANGHEPRIDVDAQLELVHAQDVAKRCLDFCHASAGWHPDQKHGFHVKHGMTEVRLPGTPIKVSELLSLLQQMHQNYSAQIIPDLSCLLHLQLFNTLRSYLYPQHYPCSLDLRTDDRGTLFEAVKTKQSGQTFISSTKPQRTRGNHFHLRKVERFLVLQGEAEISLRKLFTKEVQTFRVAGEAPAYIDIPTFYTHNIVNRGTSELMTLFWSNEIFDPNDSDTFFEPVLI